MSAGLKVAQVAIDTSWFPDWSAHTCVVVASGPSANTVNLATARGKAKFIAVNNSWRLCPWADVLYACDFSWWDANAGVTEFLGMRVSQDPKVNRKWPAIRYINCIRSYEDKGPSDRRGSIGWGGNGGFQAVNLAVQFGCKRIVLVGFDMRIDRGLHWHGKHGKYKSGLGEMRALKNPHAQQVERWRKAMDACKPWLDARGIKVINCSLVSALRNYPKMKFEDALCLSN